MFSAIRLGACLTMCFGVACSGAEPDHRGSRAPDPLQATTLEASSFAKPLIRLPLPERARFGELTSLVAVADGYAALYRKSLASGKESELWEHRVFLSSDGVNWVQHDVPQTGEWTTYRALAYGAGRYLLAGHASGQKAQLARSDDGVTWRAESADMPAVRNVAFVNGRFFALTNQHGIYTSSDGVSFVGAPTKTIQLESIVYGEGTYVAVGSGPISTSRDGSRWNAVSLDCGIIGACTEAPDGTLFQGYHSRVFYGGGMFVATSWAAEGALVSSDAEHWSAITDPARVPSTFAGGWFLKLATDHLTAWRSEEPALRADVIAENPAQLDCRTHTCLLFPDALLLVP